MRRAVALVPLLMLCAGCAANERDKEAAVLAAAIPKRTEGGGRVRLTTEERTAIGLEIAPATEGDLPQIVNRFGVARPRPGDDALVVAPTAVRVIRPPLLNVGAKVVAGQLLLEVVPVLAAADKVSVEVRGAQLEGQLRSTEKELKTREAEAERARQLAQSNIVSAAKLQEAETAVATARAQVEALRNARSLSASAGGGVLPLRAPISGTLVTLRATVGAVSAQGDLLARVVADGPAWVDIRALPQDGEPAYYEVLVDDRWLRARSISSGAVVETDGFRRDIAELDVSGGLRPLPGAVVSVRAPQGNQRGVIIPESALVPAVGGEVVYVESDGAFIQRRVQVAARFDGKVRLGFGVAAGERVVVRGAMSLFGESSRSSLGSRE